MLLADVPELAKLPDQVGLQRTADNYVVQKHSQQPEPLNTLIVASALSVDTALKQDARGLG